MYFARQPILQENHQKEAKISEKKKMTSVPAGQLVQHRVHRGPGGPTGRTNYSNPLDRSKDTSRLGPQNDRPIHLTATRPGRGPRPRPHRAPGPTAGRGHHRLNQVHARLGRPAKSAHAGRLLPRAVFGPSRCSIHTGQPIQRTPAGHFALHSTVSNYASQPSTYK